MQDKDQNIFLIIPSSRNVDVVLNAWKQELSHVHIIIVEDSRLKKMPTTQITCQSLQVYCWDDIDHELKEKSWIVSRKNSAIRIFGFLKAYQQKATIIISIDDDCYPLYNKPYFVRQHIENLSLKVPNRWINTYPDRRFLYTRGIPYLIRSESPVVLSHGLWTNVLDLDAPTHLQYLPFRAQFAENFLQIIPKGAFFPFCSMNFSFQAEITPLLYFPLMGENNQGNRWGYDRFDDIWAGLYAKKYLTIWGCLCLMVHLS